MSDGKFRKGASGNPAGKQKGTVNTTTKLLKEAILLAAEAVGENGKGKDGLVGYLKRVARKDVKAFASLLGRVIPLQVTGDGGGPVKFIVERRIVRADRD